MRYVNTTISKFVNDLGRKSPAPGGGSAAALCACLGIALLEMTCHYSLKKNEGKIGMKRLSGIIKKLRMYRSRAMKAIDRDIVVYRNFNRVYCLYKAKKKGPKDIEKAAEASCSVPYGLCRLIDEVGGLSVNAARYSNKYIISDCLCGLSMLSSAFTSSALNVEMNLKFCKNDRAVRDIRKKLNAMEKRMTQVYKRVSKTVKLSIRGR